MFTCTASCAHATGSYTCAAEGRTKSEAKTAAAAGLLEQITEHERSAAAQLARAAEAEVRSTRGLGASTIARPRSADGVFSLGGVTDLAWQLALDGEPLSEAEADAVAAADGVARLRGRWVLIDPDSARRACERHLGELTGAQALSAALTGQITVDGQDVACVGAGRLAGLVAALRDAGNDSGDPVDVPGGLRAALRGYQHQALRWLARTTELDDGELRALVSLS